MALSSEQHLLYSLFNSILAYQPIFIAVCTDLYAFKNWLNFQYIIIQDSIITAGLELS